VVFQLSNLVLFENPAAIEYQNCTITLSATL